MNGWLKGLLACLAICLSQTVAAQTWPSKPIRIVIGVPTGVLLDLYARLYAEGLSKSLGVAVIVDNKPGVGLTLASDIVAKSEADGYTLLYAPNSAFTMAPHLYSKLPFDASRDLKPVTFTLGGAFLIVANNDLPAKNIKELVELARSKPGQIDYASYGPGSAAHIGFELLAERAGIKMTHIPYRQGVVPDLIGGVVALSYESSGSILPMVKTGKVKALAYTGPQRFAPLPDVATVAEDYPGYELTGWHGFFVPSKTPDAVVQRLFAEITKISETPAMRARMQESGNEPRSTPPAEAARIIAKESAELGAVIKKLNIRLD